MLGDIKTFDYVYGANGADLTLKSLRLTWVQPARVSRLSASRAMPISMPIRATSTLAGGGSIKGVDTGDITTAPKVSIGDVCVTEGDGVKAEFKVTLDHAYAYDIKVVYSTLDGDAKDGVGQSGPGVPDFAAGSGYVIIKAGETEATICVHITNDNDYEATEHFNVHLGSTVADIPGSDIAVAICDADGDGTIKNDDAPPAFSINDVCVDESAGTITFTVHKEGASAFSHSVNVDVNPGVGPGGAVVGDYLAQNPFHGGVVTFGPSGSDDQQITFKIVDDQWHKIKEHFTVDLSNATNGATIADAQGIGEIKDNDAAPIIIPLCDTDGNELLANWDFEASMNIPDNGFVSSNAPPPGWFNVDGGELEVSRDPYGQQVGFGAGEHQWLDSAGSPGKRPRHD